MADPTGKALALWGIAGAACHFVAGRENRVYRVETPSDVYALRFKRPGYRTRAELTSELVWMAQMARAGMRVPAPLPALDGQVLQVVDGACVDLIGWLDGAPMGESGAPLALPDAARTFRELGRVMARLHAACDAWTPPDGFTRCRWDAAGLVGPDPLWGRFWENPDLDSATREMLVAFRDRARDDLARLDFDQGLIHADLVRENVLIAADQLCLIDFDDGGFGYRLFDVATALLKNRREPEYPALKAALISGYREVRALDTQHLDLFLALRAVTYLGWIVPRLAEDGAAARNTRFIRDARDLCAAYLGQMRETGP